MMCFEAVLALHQLPNGPLIHMDSTARQFVFDEDKIRVLDFNRSKFVTYLLTLQSS